MVGNIERYPSRENDAKRSPFTIRSKVHIIPSSGRHNAMFVASCVASFLSPTILVSTNRNLQFYTCRYSSNFPFQISRPKRALSFSLSLSCSLLPLCRWKRAIEGSTTESGKRYFFLMIRNDDSTLREVHPLTLSYHYIFHRWSSNYLVERILRIPVEPHDLASVRYYIERWRKQANAKSDLKDPDKRIWFIPCTFITCNVNPDARNK